MKISIKKLLQVGKKIKVVYFEDYKEWVYKIEDKARILENVEKNENIKNFRILSESDGLMRVSYTLCKVPEKLDCIRSIIKVQSNAIQFEGKSWLYFPPASQSELTENGFVVWEKDDDGKVYGKIEYIFID